MDRKNGQKKDHKLTNNRPTTDQKWTKMDQQMDQQITKILP